MAADPIGWLGSERRCRGDGDNGILVKLLDRWAAAAGARPSGPRFRRLPPELPLRQDRGLVRARPPSEQIPASGSGFTQDVDPAGARAAGSTRRTPTWMLARMQQDHGAARGRHPGSGRHRPCHRRRCLRGRSAGADRLLDLLEWSVTTATRDESHLDLGFPTGAERRQSPRAAAPTASPTWWCTPIRQPPAHPHATAARGRGSVLPVGPAGPPAARPAGDARVEPDSRSVIVLTGTGVITGRDGVRPLTN